MTNPADPAEEMAYVSFKDCGCVAMVTMETVKIAGRMVAEAVKHRERIERMSPAAVRALPFRCVQHATKKVASQ